MKSFVYILILSTVLLLSVFSEMNAQPSSIKKNDSLQKVLNNTKAEDTTKVNILNEISRNYYAINPNLGLQTGRSALFLAQRINFKQGIALAHNAIGLNYWMLAKYSNALKNLLYALDLYEEIKDTAGIVKIRGNIGLIYLLSGMVEKGIEQQLIVSKIDTKYMDSTAQIMNLVNIAGGYRELKEYHRSLHYYDEAMKLKDKFNAKEFDYHLYLNRAMTLAKLNQYELAFRSLNQARIAKNNFGMEDKYREIMWDAEYGGLIVTYLIDTNRNKNRIKEFEQNKATLLADANRKLKSTIDFFKSIQAINELKNSYLNYAEYFKLRRKMDSAYYYQELGYQLKDTIEARNSVETIRLIEVEREIAKQKNEILRQNDYNSYSRAASYFIIVFVCVLIIFIVYLMKAISKNRILNATLKEKNNEITQTNTELEAIVSELSEKQIQIAQANDKLHLANQAKDKFFSIISHDLRSPFTGIIGLSDLLSNDFDRIPKSELQNISKAINSAAKNTYAMLNSLLEWAKTQMGAMKFSPSECTAQTRIECVVQSLINTAKAKDILINYDNNGKILINCDAEMINIVLRNLISNSIKFTNPGGRIMVAVIRENDYAKFCVKDNGIGMRQEIINDLFKVEKVITTKGTNSEVGTGLGLLLCKEFIDIHKGRIWVESEVGNGTTFCFTIPISE